MWKLNTSVTILDIQLYFANKMSSLQPRLFLHRFYCAQTLWLIQIWIPEPLTFRLHCSNVLPRGAWIPRYEKHYFQDRRRSLPSLMQQRLFRSFGRWFPCMPPSSSAAAVNVASASAIRMTFYSTWVTFYDLSESQVWLKFFWVSLSHAIINE